MNKPNRVARFPSRKPNPPVPFPTGKPNPPTPFPTREGGEVQSRGFIGGRASAPSPFPPFPLREGGRGVRFAWVGILLTILVIMLSAHAGAPSEPIAPVPSQALPKVKLTTPHGGVEIELYEDDAPNTVANFIELCEKHFFDGLKFHDVINGRWVQTGDPTGTGRGGPSYKFANEINAESLGLDKIMVKDFAVKYKQPVPPGAGGMTLKDLYEKQGFHFVPGLNSHPVVQGSVAMAYRTPDSNGSQFFIALSDCPWLNGKHTVFGRVLTGLESLKLIQKGDLVDKVEVLYKRDHPYRVKSLDEGKAEPGK